MAIEVKEFYTPESEHYGAPEGYCLRCTTTGMVFGPTLEADEGPERVEEFLQWVLRWHGDPRALTPGHLTDLYLQFRKEHPA
jgi:hypothetical protein